MNYHSTIISNKQHGGFVYHELSKTKHRRLAPSELQPSQRYEVCRQRVSENQTHHLEIRVCRSCDHQRRHDRDRSLPT